MGWGLFPILEGGRVGEGERGSFQASAYPVQVFLLDLICGYSNGFSYAYGFSWWMVFLCPMLHTSWERRKNLRMGNGGRWWIHFV